MNLLGSFLGSKHILDDYIFAGSRMSRYTCSDNFRHEDLIRICSSEDSEFEVPCLFLQTSESTSLIIFCHANAEDLKSVQPTAEYLRRVLQCHVLVPEYPGYGLCRGTPSAKSVNGSVMAACLWARDFLSLQPKQIVIWGRSIGTGPAFHAASSGLAGGLVAISPFTSIHDVARDMAGNLGELLSTGCSDWDNVARMRSLTCPCFIVHGMEDEIIPYKHAVTIHESGRNRRRLALMEKVGHHETNLLECAARAYHQFFTFPSVPIVVQFPSLPVSNGQDDPQAVSTFFLQLLKERMCLNDRLEDINKGSVVLL